MITATLAADSPLRRAFPEGLVPLTQAETVMGKRNEQGEAPYLWLIDSAQCSLTQLGILGDLLLEAHPGTREAIVALIAAGSTIPIGTRHITGIHVNSRALI